MLASTTLLTSAFALVQYGDQPKPRAVDAGGAVVENPAPHVAARGVDFVKLFDGKTLNGWKLCSGDGVGYVVADGCIVAPKNGGGNLFTEKEYTDFVFRVEFKTEPGGNNGIGIRAPYEGDAAYVGMEIQVLDDDAPEYKNLLPGQYCGSVYKVSPVKRGALKKAGEWNAMEVTAIGRRVQVKLNGQLVNDADLNAVTDPGTLAEHPGILREGGHVGFLGHQSLVSFRNPEIADLSKPRTDNAPPDGFVALFDGKSLAGWKGLVAVDTGKGSGPEHGGPPARAAMRADQLAKEQGVADQLMRDHWKIVDGCLAYDGGGQSLCTSKDYANFEMWVDWKIGKGGDSGIYLRGSPQVQIWDNPIGSGGLFNNDTKTTHNESNPVAVADRPVGEWNRFKILMVGEKVTVYLNDVLVVNHTTLENYWERGKPIYPTGQIELQHHHSPLWFKNVFVRELPTSAASSGAQH